MRARCLAAALLAALALTGCGSGSESTGTDLGAYGPDIGDAAPCAVPDVPPFRPTTMDGKPHSTARPSQESCLFCGSTDRHAPIATSRQPRPR